LRCAACNTPSDDVVDNLSPFDDTAFIIGGYEYHYYCRTCLELIAARRMKMPVRYLHSRFTNFDWTCVDAKTTAGTVVDLQKLLETLVQENRPIVLQADEVGIGKTHLAAACAVSWAMMNRRRDALFVDCLSWFSRLARSGWKFNEILEELLWHDMLVLDDIGREPEYQDHVKLVLREFYNQRKMLIITSNLNRGMFYDRFGMEIVSRLFETGQFITLTGTVKTTSGRTVSYREQLAKK